LWRWVSWNAFTFTFHRGGGGGRRSRSVFEIFLRFLSHEWKLLLTRRSEMTLHYTTYVYSWEEWRKGDSYINIWLSHHPIKKALIKLFINSGREWKSRSTSLFLCIFLFFYFSFYIFFILFFNFHVVVQLVVELEYFKMEKWKLRWILNTCIYLQLWTMISTCIVGVV